MTINERRLDELARDIARLDTALIELQREAGELYGDERDCELRQQRVAETKLRLERSLRAYYIESEVVRRGLKRAS